jgi:hypothetical protein
MCAASPPATHPSLPLQALRGLRDKASAKYALSPISPIAIAEPCAIIEALYE